MNFSLFEATPGIHLIVRPDDTFSIASASNDFVRASGFTRDRIVGRSFFNQELNKMGNLFFTGDRSFETYFNQVITLGTTVESEAHFFDSSGPGDRYAEAYWKLKFAPVPDEAGKPSLIILSAADQTEFEISRKIMQSSGGLKKAYNFFMNAPVIIGLVMGEEYVIELANEGLLEVWGRTSEVVGKPLLEAIPELESQGFIALLDEVRKTGKPFYAYEFPIVLVRQGKEETLYFDFVYKPFYEDEDSTVADGVISVGHEVTKQVLAKKNLEESEEKYRTLFESMEQGFCIIEVIFDEKDRAYDYRFLEINPAFEKQSGLLNAEGKTIREFSPDMEEKWFTIYGHIALGGEPVKVIEESKALGRWFDVYAFKTGGPDERKVAAFFTDITDQVKAQQEIKDSDQRFRNLADESPIFVFIIDADPSAPVTYWNKTWLEYTGQTIEEAMGRAWDGTIHTDDVEIVMSHYLPAYKDQQAYLIPAVRVKKHDGTYRWHSFKGNPRYLANGQFNGYVGVGFDIHDQKMAEEALKQNEKMLQQKVAERTADLERLVEELKRSNTNLEEFAYAASHDMKEPIRKIHFFGERIKDSMSDRMTADEVRYFERLDAAAKRMGSLIDDLLSYSQISIRPRSFDDVNMNQLMDLVLEDLDLEIEDKGAEILVDNLFTIRGHHRQLQQAFQNLISNALKYSKPGEIPRIEIHCRMMKGNDSNLHLSFEDQQRQFYCISITDNGIGFDQSDAERIFNVFTRLHGNAEYRGTGIGLSIVRKVIENHNGYIWAESEPGQGSAFHVLLPAELGS